MLKMQWYTAKAVLFFILSATVLLLWSHSWAGPIARATPIPSPKRAGVESSMHCSVLAEYLRRDEQLIVRLVREIRGIEDNLGLSIAQRPGEENSHSAKDSDLTSPVRLNVSKVLSNKKKELKFALHNLERHHIHAVRTCGLRAVVNESRCSAVSSALAPSLRYIAKLKKKIHVAEENLNFLKKRDDSEYKSKHLSGQLAFGLKWANVPPFVLSVAAGLIPMRWAAGQKFFQHKLVTTTKALGLPATFILVATMVWNTSSKRKSAAIHLDYMQTRDFLMSSKEELDVIENKLLASIEQEFLNCKGELDSNDIVKTAPQFIDSTENSTACFIPSNFNDLYENHKDSIENALDDKIMSSGIGFYDRDFDKLETEEIRKMLGIAVGEIITLVASAYHFSNPYLKAGTKIIAVAGSVVFGYSLYKSLFSKDKFEALKEKYFIKHRTIAEIQTLEEDLAYLEALSWVVNSDAKALCK